MLLTVHPQRAAGITLARMRHMHRYVTKSHFYWLLMFVLVGIQKYFLSLLW
jgi:hypothetical protein